MNSVTPPEVTTYVRYYHPGALLSEESDHDVSERDPLSAARNAPESAFAFSFFDRVTATAAIGGKAVPLRSAEVNVSGRYFIDAEPFPDPSVAVMPRTLLRCRAGNLQHLGYGDMVISTGGGTP